MNHRYEAVLQSDGAWAVNELIGEATVAATPGLNRRDALHQAVRLNRDVLRQERQDRLAKAYSSL